jgi:hypothetical protein
MPFIARGVHNVGYHLDDEDFVYKVRSAAAAADPGARGRGGSGGGGGAAARTDGPPRAAARRAGRRAAAGVSGLARARARARPPPPARPQPRCAQPRAAPRPRRGRPPLGPGPTQASRCTHTTPPRPRPQVSYYGFEYDGNVTSLAAGDVANEVRAGGRGNGPRQPRQQQACARARASPRPQQPPSLGRRPLKRPTTPPPQTPPAAQVEHAALLRALALARQGHPGPWAAWRAAVLPLVAPGAPPPSPERQRELRRAAAAGGGAVWLLPRAGGAGAGGGALSAEERRLAAEPGWAEPLGPRLRRYLAALKQAAAELDGEASIRCGAAGARAKAEVSRRHLRRPARLHAAHAHAPQPLC